MTETVFEKLAAAAATLKLDFSSEEFALYAEEHELSEEEIGDDLSADRQGKSR